MLLVPDTLLRDTFGHLRSHGRGRSECVVYWIGPVDEPDRVDEVVHPVHTCRAGGYQIDSPWLTKFWLDLAARRKSVRVQVHTHPGTAFHSDTDDEWALLPDPGFLSLVIPKFAQGRVGLRGAFLAERQPDGGWAEVPRESRFHMERSRSQRRRA